MVAAGGAATGPGNRLSAGPEASLLISTECHLDQEKKSVVLKLITLSGAIMIKK